MPVMILVPISERLAGLSNRIALPDSPDSRCTADLERFREALTIGKHSSYVGLRKMIARGPRRMESNMHGRGGRMLGSKAMGEALSSGIFSRDLQSEARGTPSSGF